MFFSSELLEKRDSGFGLLWLAATLGSKSTFKKLPKRSVLTADIEKLCDLIAQPAEPLALRLSSNLMVGAARVYKVKQEIFMTDVTTCFNSLKKVVQEIHLSGSDAQLQIVAQASVRPGAVTLAADPAFAMDFDTLVADWDEYLNINEKPEAGHGSGDEFDPKFKKAHRKQKGTLLSLPLSENVRADLYTLKEHHEHLLSASFDASFNGSGVLDPSSSQIDGGLGFSFDDNFFDVPDGLDVGGEIGDELARELGDGWGLSPRANEIDAPMEIDDPVELGIDDIGMRRGMEFDFDGPNDAGNYANADSPTVSRTTKPKKTGSDKENVLPYSVPNSDSFSRSALSPLSFSHQLLSQDLRQPSLQDIASETGHLTCAAPRKPKRVRLLLDSRTELTDDELKTARSKYLEGQEALRREMELKRSEKESGKRIEDMIWGIPNGFHAQDLIDFWSENFKVMVEARSGVIQIDLPAEPPRKRRKANGLSPNNEDRGGDVNGMWIDFDYGDAQMGDGEMSVWMKDRIDHDGNIDDADRDRLRSSEEPGQARRASRPPSIQGGNFEFDIEAHDPRSGSQRSSLFPWDNAGVSSSNAPAFDPVGAGSDRVSIDRTSELRLRRSRSGSRRESSLLPSQLGGNLGVRFSPAVLDYESHLEGEDFAFDLSLDKQALPNLDSQQSDVNLITLERNSFNFLEYAKMQSQGLPDSVDLTFENVVPQSASTRRVASVGFYHCLVLATKDLIHLSQPFAYGAFTITIV